jgi:ATP-dependent Clp protease ATP-binding subunit ClpC
LSDFSSEIERAFGIALSEARQQNSPIVGTPHLFIALIKLDGDTAAALRGQGHDPKRIRDGLRAALGQGQAAPGTEPKLTERAAQILHRAKKLAESEGATQAEERHLLAAILQDEPDSITLRALHDLGVDVVALRFGVLFGPPMRSRIGQPKGTPILNRIGRDLTSLARKRELEPLIGRREQLRQIVRTLARKNKNNPVLVGLAGVGKTAIVEGLAALIAAGQIPDELKDCRLIELPMAALVAGTTYRGQFEERLLGLVKEVKAAENVILFIDEIHTILRAGAVEGGSLDAGNILKPALARGDLRVIGATTPEEYQRYIMQDAALERRFQQVWVPEPRPEEALEMLRGVKARYEMHHGVMIADEALEAAVKLSVAWLPDRHLPDKALDLLDEACARARIPTISKPTDKMVGLVVTARTVAEVLGEWKGISVDALLDAE